MRVSGGQSSYQAKVYTRGVRYIFRTACIDLSLIRWGAVSGALNRAIRTVFGITKHGSTR